MIRDIGYLKLQATNLVHKAARQRMTGKSVGLAYANHQLAVQMGWMPLINDLKHLLDFQARVDRKIQDLDTLFNKKGGLHRTVGRNPDKPRKTSSKSQSSLFSQTVSATGIINCDTRLGLVLQVRQSKITEAEAWGTIRWHSTELPGTHWSNKELAAKARSIVFGANINPKAIWDAIPWTWLIGWFANVDEFLSSNTNVIPVSGSNVCMMFRTRTTYTFDRTDGWQAIFLGGYGKATYEHKQRLISSGSLSASVPFIGAREFSILGALAMQRLPRWWSIATEEEDMSLGTTLTVTLDGSGGTAKILPLINQDGYASEYFLDEATVSYRAKVRHSKDSVKAGTQAFDRHVVTFTRYLKPTTTFPLGLTSEIIYTIRNSPVDTQADVIDLSEAMSFYMVKAGGIATKLLGWES
jgi:hypothetical protein